MLGLRLVRPLEDDWRDALDRVARDRGWPTSRDVAKLAARVAALSAAYNDPGRARAAVRDAGAARLGFSFARDVPKSAGAVRELVEAGFLGLSAPLRVLDVGAGLGASTWGVARALEAAGQAGEVEADWVDPDAEALALALAIARAREGQGRVTVRPRAVARPAAALDDLGRYSLVLAGQILSELDVGLQEAARVDRHAALLAAWVELHLEPDGSLVVVEPALRDRTRHLHRVRDALLAAGVTVFAPCLHASSCPALAIETNWCHEDLDVDLPAWLAPVARAAGLRREGLTFSYLVLRRDARRLANAVAPAPRATALRVVSGAVVSKGKREAFLCGELFRGGPTGSWRATRLDRSASATNEAWGRLARGDLVTLDPPLDAARPRIEARASVGILDDVKSR